MKRLFELLLLVSFPLAGMELTIPQKMTRFKKPSLSLEESLELVHLSIYIEDYKKASKIYQRLYAHEKDINFLYEAALTASVGDAQWAFRLWNEFFDIPNESRIGKRWNALGSAFQSTIQYGSLQNESLIKKEIRQAYLGKGWALAKTIIDLYKKYAPSKKDPSSKEILFVEADLYATLKYYPEAIQRFEKLESQLPGDRIRYHLGKTYYLQAMYPQAVKVLEKVESREWKKFNYYYILGRAYYHIGRKKEANICVLRSQKVIENQREERLFHKMTTLVGY